MVMTRWYRWFLLQVRMYVPSWAPLPTGEHFAPALPWGRLHPVSVTANATMTTTASPRRLIIPVPHLSLSVKADGTEHPAFRRENGGLLRNLLRQMVAQAGGQSGHRAALRSGEAHVSEKGMSLQRLDHRRNTVMPPDPQIV